MSDKEKQTHTNYCNYMIAKANNTYFVYKKENTIKSGIKSNNMSRTELILALAN